MGNSEIIGLHDKALLYGHWPVLLMKVGWWWSLVWCYCEPLINTTSEGGFSELICTSLVGRIKMYLQFTRNVQTVIFLKMKSKMSLSNNHKLSGAGNREKTTSKLWSQVAVNSYSYSEQICALCHKLQSILEQQLCHWPHLNLILTSSASSIFAQSW